MKKIIVTALAALTLATLTGCPGGGGGKGNSFVTSPNSCFSQPYVMPTGGGTPYYGTPGQPVNCNPGYYGNGYFYPGSMYYNGQYMNGCQGWSMIYPDSYYIPMNVMGYGVMCVKSSYFTTLPGWNNWYGTYGTYPTSAMNCIVGVNCPANCFNAGAGASAGGMVWLGGTLSLCL